MSIPYQNRKIAAIAASFFMISLALMMFFLGSMESFNHGETNVLDHGKTEEANNSEQMDGPGFVTNTQGEFLFISDSFCELISFDCQAVMKGKMFDFINSKELPDFVSSFTKLVGEGERMEGIGPFRVITGDKEKLLLFTAIPELGKKDKVTRVVFIVKDLTEQAEELNKNENSSPEKDEADFEWVQKLYPKIKDMDKEDGKLLVDKISFVSELITMGKF